jgi:hypothetical protein
VRPWGLTPTEEAEVLRSLRFRHFKWDTFVSGAQTILPETMVVDEALHREVVTTVEALHQALLRFEARVVAHPQDPRRLGLRNLSTAVWSAEAPDGRVQPVQPGESCSLAALARIQSPAGPIAVQRPTRPSPAA